jgi:acyl-CoA reductase-like NAD-dependent aldehyde dehydrogenase
MSKSVITASWHDRAAALAIDGRPFVAGKRVAARGEREFDLTNPYTGVKIASLTDSSDMDVDDAVAAARRGVEARVWAGMSVVDRAAILQRWADAIEADADLIGLLDTVQMGMPVGVSVPGVPMAALGIRNAAELAVHAQDLIAPSAPYVFAMQARRPQGVVAAISPWNYPLGTALSLLGPALATGNSVVLKPSEVAPLACLRVAELALEAGVPPGVLNVVPGLGPTVGRALALHRDVNFLTFIGSTATGRLIAQYAGQSNLKPLMLECGGKSPQIIFDDLGDIDGLADAVIAGFTENSGQVCTSGARILVAAPLYDRLAAAMADKIGAMQTGDPLNDDTKLGPMAFAPHADKVRRLIAEGLTQDELIAKGGTSGAAETEVAPHLFAAGSSSSALVHEEIFGPVATLQRFSDEEEAVRLANDTDYGLSALIWTSSAAQAHRVIPVIRAGFVQALCVPSPKPPGIRFLSGEPFGMSGYGVHGGQAGLAPYTRMQAGVFHFQ